MLILATLIHRTCWALFTTPEPGEGLLRCECHRTISELCPAASLHFHSVCCPNSCKYQASLACQEKVSFWICYTSDTWLLPTDIALLPSSYSPRPGCLVHNFPVHDSASRMDIHSTQRCQLSCFVAISQTALHAAYVAHVKRNVR